MALDSGKLPVDQLTGPQATLLMPLWARARESRRTDAILRDDTAVKIVDSLEFDFERFARQRVPTVDYCLRASIFDRLVRNYLATHPDATVVEFGAGLDTRFDRLDNGRVRWIEVDLPDVIRLRRRFFAEDSRRKMIAASLCESDWIDELEHAGCVHPLFVAEGVFYFLTASEVRLLFQRIADRFAGSELIFDAQSPLYLQLSNLRHPLRSTRLSFALRRDGAEIERWDPRFRIKEYVGFGDSPDYDQAWGRLSTLKRLAISARILTRHMFKVIHVGFRGQPNPT
jgi:O-methyltransferase involved in polyketide biosynthesis